MKPYKVHLVHHLNLTIRTVYNSQVVPKIGWQRKYKKYFQTQQTFIWAVTQTNKMNTSGARSIVADVSSNMIKGPLSMVTAATTTDSHLQICTYCTTTTNYRMRLQNHQLVSFKIFILNISSEVGHRATKGGWMIISISWDYTHRGF